MADTVLDPIGALPKDTLGLHHLEYCPPDLTIVSLPGASYLGTSNWPLVRLGQHVVIVYKMNLYCSR